MEKHYDTDWAKAKSRKLVKSVIERNILRFRRPKDLSVLCFPGIDATEIFEVYDSLNIPRGNIVGLERDASIADQLRKKDLGIRVVSQSLEEYVQNHDMDFDVISLDFIGPLNKSKIASFQEISAKQQKNHFVFHSANLIARDRSSTGLYHYGHSLRSTGPIAAEKSIFPIDRLETIIERGNGMFAKICQKEAFTDEKKNAYSTLVSACFLGRSIESCNEYFRFTHGNMTQQQYHMIIDSYSQKISEIIHEIVRIDPEKPFYTMHASPYFPIIQTLLEHFAYGCLEQDFIRNGITDKKMQFLFWIMLNDASKKQKFFRIKDAETYSYISESGSPMIGDVYFVSYPKRLCEVSKQFARECGYPLEFRLDHRRANQIIHTTIFDFCAAQRKFSTPESIENVNDKIQNRQFLGNSSRPILTKKRAIDEFISGATIEHIIQKYRACAGKPLAAWQAHATMGTYHPDIDMPDDCDILTKEDAIELISFGIPIDEIVCAYPTSFSSGQLRAIKAHVSRRTYNKNSL